MESDLDYSVLSNFFERVESLSGRLDMIEETSELFRMVIKESPKTLVPCVYFCCNELWPSYMGRELGIGDTILIKAVCGITGDTPQSLKQKIKTVGDLGTVTQELLSNKSIPKLTTKSITLTIEHVFKELRAMTLLQGKTVVNRKIVSIQNLLTASQGSEAKFIIRCIQGKMRIGLQESSVIKALAKAIHPNSITEATKAIEQAYIELPNHDLVIPLLLSVPIEDLLKHCKLTPGVPVKSMLGKPTKEIDEVYKRFKNSKISVEYKYDGERAQIHLLPPTNQTQTGSTNQTQMGSNSTYAIESNDSNKVVLNNITNQTQQGEIKIFSRNSEDNTSKYPDLLSRLKNSYNSNVTSSFVIDCEVVAYDIEEQKILPFQTLSTRKRKNEESGNIKVQVAIFAFDLLYLNGESLMSKTFEYRRDMLYKTFHQVPNEFYFAQCKDFTSDQGEEIDDFLIQAVKDRCEGVMVKRLTDDSCYVPNKRNWLKIKKDYLEGVTDTLDLVPIGAYFGKGKRVGVYGAFLLACYDKTTDTLQSITKIGTGFSDDDLASHFKSLSSTTIDTIPENYKFATSLKPDVLFAPTQVWEVLAADLSLSPIHLAAMGTVHKTKGIALRFPRFIRLRSDKSPKDCTDAEQVVQLFQNQSVQQ